MRWADFYAELIYAKSDVRQAVQNKITLTVKGHSRFTKISLPQADYRLRLFAGRLC